MRTLTLFIILAIALVTVGVSTSPSVVAQKQTTTVSKHPFEAEQLFYEAEFSRAIFRKLDVADFTFSASRAPLNQSKNDATENAAPYTLVFKAEISSKGFFTRLFNLNFKERVESIVEPQSFTIQRTNILDEQGKRIRATETTFDRSNGKMLWTQRDPNNPTREPRQIITDFSGQLQDVLSAIYFIRTQQLQVGKSFEIFIGDGGRVYKVPVHVVEKKRMKTILGRVNVVRIDPDLFGPDRIIDEEKGQFSLWLTDDHRRVPVIAKLKTDYGTFDIKLKRIAYGSAN